MKEIIINKNGNTVVALLENGKLVEEYDDSSDFKVLEGNIYCGKVKNILPGMQSAFIDIGEEKNAFIHIKDIIPKASNETGNKEEILSKYKIKDYIKQNEPILVQVKKDEENQKGARISKHISLTGRLCVLMIDVDFITISQKIEDKQERAKLKEIATNILKKYPEKYGLILRTAAVGKSKEDIEKDVAELIELWESVQQAYKQSVQDGKTQLIYQNYDIITKFLTSVLETNIEKITVNKNSLYNSIKKYLETIKRNDIELILNTDQNLMEIYDLQEQIDKMQNRKIWLKCGGFITIDKTEALTAIDVNSGKFTGSKKSSRESMVLKVNQEATIEIARQLRLRNISGIIVIDYIDMEKDEERESILKLLEEELKKDRSKTQVVGFTKLDLLEMTRKRI
ncbi:MAG: Rne/Rng family ribonuclease [Clostridia bacterium]